MKKKFKNFYIRLVTIGFFIILFTSSCTKTYQMNFLFDYIFPMTWYQKGLESSMHVWQALANVFDSSSDELLLSFDSMLGRLAFTQFCINRMYQEDISCISGDKTYFIAVLDKVKQLLALVVITPKTQDFLLCADDMIQSMQKKIASTIKK
ncbi:MAG TPA: hypothetical protein VLB80_01205 [Candidatus Babeliales bacterium]|nr:hypothetical protein [Candidatus Babeliales bacterium]